MRQGRRLDKPINASLCQTLYGYVHTIRMITIMAEYSRASFCSTLACLISAELTHSY
jgi:hypothetical protein